MFFLEVGCGCSVVVLPDAGGAGGARGEWVSPMTANAYGVGGRAGKSAFGGVACGRGQQRVVKCRLVLAQVFSFLHARGECPVSVLKNAAKTGVDSYPHALATTSSLMLSSMSMDLAFSNLTSRIA